MENERRYEAMDAKAKSVPIGLRISPEAKKLLPELAELISADLGVRVTQSQALEWVVRDAVGCRRLARGQKEAEE